MEFIFIVIMLLMLLGLAFYLGRKWERMEWDDSFEEQESRRTKHALDAAKTCRNCNGLIGVRSCNCDSALPESPRQ